MAKHKQTVFYTGEALKFGSRCVIKGVIDHPRLGDCPVVTTSQVLRHEHDGTIETLNTIYVKKAA